VLQYLETNWKSWSEYIRKVVCCCFPKGFNRIVSC